MRSFSLDDFQGAEKPVITMRPHTQKKHEILRRYLHAWFYIMSSESSRNGRIIYIDGFAGPGLYDSGDVGSPVIALECLLNHQLSKTILSRKVEFVFIFIEKDEQRIETLRKTIAEKFPDLPNNVKIHLFKGGFQENIRRLLDAVDSTGKRMAPTFAFIDPFGYSDVPMEIIASIMKHPKCEVMVNFMTGFIRRFAGVDEKTEKIFDELFGCHDWCIVKDLKDADEKTKFIIDLYLKRLNTQAEARFVQRFEMYNQYNQPHYDLVFATNGKEGMKAMKDAMYKVDKDCTWSFWDRDSSSHQTRLIDFLDVKEWTSRASKLIFERYRGGAATREDIEWFVILQTPYVYRKGCLELLEKENKITRVDTVDGKRKKYTYPEGSIVYFAS